MHKKIKAYWAFFFGLLVLLSACYKDLGNYNYNDINQVSIRFDTTSYTVLIGQALKVQPLVQMSMDTAAGSYDTSRYSYQWMIRDTANAEDRIIEIATTRDLNKLITLNEAFSGPGAFYKLYYKVTDKKTRIESVASVKLTVLTINFEGWLALCDINGSSRLDMAVCSKGGFTNLIPDVLGVLNSGLDMLGKPVNVSYCTSPSVLTPTPGNGIYITTSKGTNRINANSFSWAANMNLRFDYATSIPSDFAVDQIVGTLGQVNYLHTPNGDLYAYNYTVPSIKWGAAINMVQGESAPFKCSPFIAIDAGIYSGFGGALLFDVTKRRFLTHLATLSSPNPLFCVPVTTTGTYFNYQNVGMDLVYMEEVINYGEVFAVFKNPTTGNYHLARISFGKSAPSFAQNYFAQITGTDIGKAENFAVSPDYASLFYNVGSKVYEYDLGLKQSFLVKDYGIKNISILKFHHFQSSNYTTPVAGYQKLINKLVIATYDPSQPSTSGTIDVWTVPALNAPLQAYSSISGLGKVQSLTYRER